MSTNPNPDRPPQADVVHLDALVTGESAPNRISNADGRQPLLTVVVRRCVTCVLDVALLLVLTAASAFALALVISLF